MREPEKEGIAGLSIIAAAGWVKGFASSLSMDCIAWVNNMKIEGRNQEKKVIYIYTYMNMNNLQEN